MQILHEETFNIILKKKNNFIFQKMQNLNVKNFNQYITEK